MSSLSLVPGTCEDPHAHVEDVVVRPADNSTINEQVSELREQEIDIFLDGLDAENSR